MEYQELTKKIQGAENDTEEMLPEELVGEAAELGSNGEGFVAEPSQADGEEGVVDDAMLGSVQGGFGSFYRICPRCGRPTHNSIGVCNECRAAAKQ